eukprot:s27_g5.t1
MPACRKLSTVVALVVLAWATLGNRLFNSVSKSCRCFAHQPRFLRSNRQGHSSTALLKHVGKMLTTFCEVPGNSAVPVIISVSGGQDSVALLCLVHQVARRYPWKLQVLHFNHGLRPEASDEELFVKDLAKTLEVPFFVRRHPDPTALKGSKAGLQAAAREWRQAESKKLLSDLETAEKGVILLAHHADDQVETQLLKLLRGAHLAQLGGMRARDGPFARPLLEIRKEELRAFLQSEGQSWMEDASNAFPVYQRNRIRLQLVPMLVDLLGGEEALQNRFSALGHQSRQLSSLLEELCQQHHGPRFPSPGAPTQLDISSFSQLPEMVRYEFVWRFVANCGAMLSHAAVGGIVDAIQQGDARFTWLLGSGWELKRQDSQLVILKSDKLRVEGEDKTWSCSDLFVVQNVSQLHISMELQRAQQTGCPKVAAKCSEISEIVLHGVASGSTVTLRGALPGDRFRKARLAHNIKVTSVLRELGVPPSARPNWPVITIKAPGGENGEDGEVVAAVLPDLVAANFQRNGTAEAQRSAQVLPTVISLSWDEAWPGLGKRCGKLGLKLEASSPIGLGVFAACDLLGDGQPLCGQTFCLSD